MPHIIVDKLRDYSIGHTKLCTFSSPKECKLQILSMGRTSSAPLLVRLGGPQGSWSTTSGFLNIYCSLQKTLFVSYFTRWGCWWGCRCLDAVKERFLANIIKPNPSTSSLSHVTDIMWPDDLSSLTSWLCALMDSPHFIHSYARSSRVKLVPQDPTCFFCSVLQSYQLWAFASLSALLGLQPLKLHIRKKARLAAYTLKNYDVTIRDEAFTTCDNVSLLSGTCLGTAPYATNTTICVLYQLIIFNILIDKQNKRKKIQSIKS